MLPYTTTTHSGQAELGRDLGLRLLAPDVPTLRDQFAAGPECPSVWFPPDALNSPERFAGYLHHAVSLPRPTQTPRAVRAYRDREHQRILDAHRDLYTAAVE